MPANILRATPLRHAAMALAVTAGHSFGSPAAAATDAAAVCADAAAAASRKTGVPLSVLLAVSLTETGRRRDGRLESWPWTVNMEGEGVWFASRAEAQAFAESAFDRGARSFDIGCFQINHKWHGEAFASIGAMFEPLDNAIYAAGFLKSLYAETGTWSLAAGAFHSRTPEFASRYRDRFDAIRANLLEPAGEDLPTIPDIVLAAQSNNAAGIAGVAGKNRYPLLQQGTASAMGSLVPLDFGGGGSIFDDAPAIAVLE